MFTTLRRIVSAGFKGFYRNFTISISAVMVMTISLLSFANIYLVSELLKPSIAQLEQKVDVNIYFTPDASEEQILFIKQELESIDEVAEIQYVTREAALESFKERQNNDVILQALESIGENPLGASFNIKADQISEYEEIAKFLNVVESDDEYGRIIENINYNQNKLAIEKLNVIIDSVQRFGIAFSIILVILAITITYNTIRLAIYTARNEVAVMRLVGASKFFARGPFIMEGIFYGLVSGVVTIAILTPSVFYASPFLREIFILDLYVFYMERFFMVAIIVLVSGMALGAFSSLLAIRKYLEI